MTRDVCRDPIFPWGGEKLRAQSGGRSRERGEGCEEQKKEEPTLMANRL